MLNSSRKPGPLEKFTLTSLSYVKCYPFFWPLEKYGHTSMIGYKLFKKMLSRINGGCYIKPLCSPAYFFSRNRCPYRGVNLPGFLRETRKRMKNPNCHGFYGKIHGNPNMFNPWVFHGFPEVPDQGRPLTFGLGRLRLEVRQGRQHVGLGDDFAGHCWNHQGIRPYSDIMVIHSM